MITIAFILLGYLFGSILFARVFESLLGKNGMIAKSKDQNPGTANAFVHGGALCGILTLIGDLAKGFLPVFAYTRYIDYTARMSFPYLLATAFVIAAPVVGHAFPVFYGFKGGKGIATSFGCLLGLMPIWQPALCLAFFFIFFSLILRITPHFYRTLTAYLFALALMLLVSVEAPAAIGFAIITAVVFARMCTSREQKEKMKVRILWTH